MKTDQESREGSRRKTTISTKSMNQTLQGDFQGSMIQRRATQTRIVPKNP